MIHSLFSCQDQNKDTNIQYPKENIQNMRKGVMVNGSEVYYGKGKKVPISTNYNKNRPNIKYNETCQKTKKTKSTYNFNTIVHNNQIKYINKEDKKIKETIKKDNIDVKTKKVSNDTKMEFSYDVTKPTCFVSVRLYNGDIIKAKFNCCEKFGVVYSFAKKMSKNDNFVLLDGFPPKPLREYGKTITELGIENAVLTQRIN